MTGLRHRIVQHRGRRYSLKLDALVWDTLERQAGQAKLRLNELVASLAAEVEEGANLTDALRTYALQQCLSRIDELDRALQARMLTSHGVPVATVTEALPSPCLVISGEHKILRANSPAQRWMGVEEAALLGKSVEHYLQVKAAVPLAEMVQQFAHGALAVYAARVVYLRPGRVIMSRANICPAVVGSPDLLAYMILIDTGAPL